MALVRLIVPGGYGHTLAAEIEQTHARDRRERGAARAWASCWREALSPSLWTLRRELRPSAASIFRFTNSPLGDPPLSRLLNDFRIAVRTLVKRPGFTLTAVGIIAVGIGASTTIFTVVDHVLLRQLPYDEPEALVVVDDPSFSVPLFLAWKDGTEGVFESFAAASTSSVDLTGGETPMNLAAASISPDFFRALRVEPVLGRNFAASEYVAEPDVVVISHGAWQRLFGGDPEVIGQTLQIDRRTRTVVGVMGADFRPPEVVVGPLVDIWVPFDATDPAWSEVWGSWFLSIVARLAPGQNLEAAQAELEALSERLVASNPAAWEDNDGAYSIEISPLLRATVGDVGNTLYLLLGAVGLMLLIACANVASLLLARATDRHREVAVRAALGASRARIAQQLLSEAMTLSLAGGALGILGAFAAVEWFNSFQPGDIPRSGAVQVDLRILGFALLTAVATGLIFGVVPAWRAVRTDLTEAIRDGSGTLSASAGRQRLRSGLVVLEVALAVVLTVGAGLLFNSFLHMTAVDPGFDTEQLVTFELGLGTYETEERLPVVEQLLDALRAVPGADSVGLGITVPFARTGTSRCCWFDTMTTDQEETEPYVAVVNPIDDGYFDTLRATMRYGRPIASADRDDDPVAVVTVTTAQNMFGRDDVVGEVLHVEGDLNLRIVGVVEDIRHWGLAAEAENELYVSYRGFHQYFRNASFLVRGQRADLTAQLREAVWSVDPRLPVDNVASMRAMVADSVAAPRFYSGIFLIFSGVALLLAAGGLYGALMFQVGQRSREIGIRMALGARGAQVVAMVVRQGMTLTAVGLGIGVAGALFLSRLLESFVFGISATDPATFVVVAAGLMLVAFVASYLPARRAGKSDPLVSLRAE